MPLYHRLKQEEQTKDVQNVRTKVFKKNVDSNLVYFCEKLTRQVFKPTRRLETHAPHQLGWKIGGDYGYARPQYVLKKMEQKMEQNCCVFFAFF